jgi:UDP-2,3-diacylglucosamine hydrolase
VLRKDIGADYHVGPWRGMLGGWDTLVEHGDGLRDVEDRPYRRLRAVLRHPLSVRVFRWLHPDWATWLAMRSSHTSRNMRPRDAGEGLRQVALGRLGADGGPRLLIFGHSHVTTLETVDGRVYANPGAWMDAPNFLRVTPGHVELCRWSGDGFIVERRTDGRAEEPVEPA